MKNYIFAMMALLTSFVASAQGNWNSNQKKNSQRMQPIGLMLGMEGAFIGTRPELNTISQGDFNAGIFIGRKPLSFLMLGGVSSHSEIVNYISEEIDPICGCAQQTNIKDFQNRLKLSYFQVGVGYQKQGTIVYLTVGPTSVRRSFPVTDSLGFVSLKNISTKTRAIFSFSFKTLIEKDMLSVQGMGVVDLNYPIGKASISYLLHFNNQDNLFGGVRAAYVSHEVSGHEFMFGPELLIGDRGLFADFSVSFGGSYNPNSNEGFGLYIGGAINFTRQNRSLFH